jgi:hypothetical protein
MTTEQQAEHDQRTIDAFNKHYPVGSECLYWEKLPFGPKKETRIRQAAFTAASGQPVCFVEGVDGHVSIFHITRLRGDEGRKP